MISPTRAHSRLPIPSRPAATMFGMLPGISMPPLISRPMSTARCCATLSRWTYLGGGERRVVDHRGDAVEPEEHRPGHPAYEDIYQRSSPHDNPTRPATKRYTLLARTATSVQVCSTPWALSDSPFGRGR